MTLGRVERLRMLLSFMRRTKNLVLLGVPGGVTLLWIMALSGDFGMGSMGIRSGFFVFFAVLVPFAVLHTVLLVIVERRLEHAEKDVQVPKATARLDA